MSRGPFRLRFQRRSPGDTTLIDSRQSNNVSVRLARYHTIGLQLVYSHNEIPDKNRGMHSAETRVTFSDDHYEIHDKNRDMPSIETKASTVSVRRTPKERHGETCHAKPFHRFPRRVTRVTAHIHNTSTVPGDTYHATSSLVLTFRLPTFRTTPFLVTCLVSQNTHV